MIASIQVARDVISENAQTPNHDKRLVFARQILQNPSSSNSVFKSLVIVDLDTTNYDSLTEAQKISGAKTRVANVFNEAGYIF